MDQMGRDLHTPPSSLIFTALRRRKTYLQSVELFYGLILLAIVRVYTIEKQSAAPPESENSTSQTFTTLGKLNIQWAEKKRLGSLGRIQALETWLKLTFELGEVFIFCGGKKKHNNSTCTFDTLESCWTKFGSKQNSTKVYIYLNMLAIDFNSYDKYL